MILSFGWAVLAVALFASSASTPPVRSMPPPFRSTATARVGPWRFARRTLLLAGFAALAGVAVVGPVVAAGLAMLALLGHWWRGRRRVADDLAAREDAVPEVVELMAVALRSGASATSAVERVAQVTGELPVVPVRVAAERLRSGLPAGDAWAALRELPEPAGPEMADLLDAAERTGAAVADSMSDLADSARAERRRRLETKVQRLPVLLLAPLVLCVLPSFLLLVCAPIVITGLGDVL
ncbi:MAG: type II secretion system F family protein [Actinomycetota bacterium]